MAKNGIWDYAKAYLSSPISTTGAAVDALGRMGAGIAPWLQKPLEKISGGVPDRKHEEDKYVTVRGQKIPVGKKGEDMSLRYRDIPAKAGEFLFKDAAEVMKKINEGAKFDDLSMSERIALASVPAELIPGVGLIPDIYRLAKAAVTPMVSAVGKSALKTVDDLITPIGVTDTGIPMKIDDATDMTKMEMSGVKERGKYGVLDQPDKKIEYENILKDFVNLKYPEPKHAKETKLLLGRKEKGDFFLKDLRTIYEIKTGKKWKPGNKDYDAVEGDIGKIYSPETGQKLSATATIQTLKTNEFLSRLDRLMNADPKIKNFPEIYDELFLPEHTKTLAAFKSKKTTFTRALYDSAKKTGMMTKKQIKYMDDLIEKMPDLISAHKQKLRPKTEVISKSEIFKGYTTEGQNLISEMMHDVAYFTKEPTLRNKIAKSIDHQVARVIEMAHSKGATEKDILNIVSKMSKIKKKRLNTLIAKKINLQDNIRLAKKNGNRYR